ncbi:MAG TPA: phosphodiester glycosidase family protein [Phycisphaerae bacterium]|nr:phosphodiester glycosidase family protein [Phycisphaerae bacterium]HRR87260.1 phosphodiester glycosidase family protein [Phycisphaerae bacterium]
MERFSRFKIPVAVLILGGLPAIALMVISRLEPEHPEPLTSPVPATGPGEQIGLWQPLFVGVEMCRASTSIPRPMQIRAVRVDCREPTIDFLVTPSNGDEPLDCNARAPSEFLKEFKCQVAINGSVFSPTASRAREPLDVRGLSLSRGNLYSPPNQYDALLIDRDRKAWIGLSPVAVGRAFNGLSGFHAILLDGRNVGTGNDLEPRSAVGISKDQRYLILMTIDGRQTNYSEGATTTETAEWLRRLGAWNGLNLDGGGSTALVIEGPDGNPLLLSSPSGKYERWVANHLGVFARRLPISSLPATGPTSRGAEPAG